MSQDLKDTAVAAGVALALLMALAAVAGCGGEAGTGKMKVSTTTYPLADFATNVGGDLVEVKALVPGGANPHTFEPTAKSFSFLSDSKVFVMNGLGYETWAADVIKKVAAPDVVLVVASDAIPESKLIKAGEYSGEKSESGAPYDPHTWLDPTIAAYQVDAIRDGFIEADPANREAYTANAAAYNEKLAALDREIAEATAKFTSRDFVALHPGWAYFSRRYGIDQAGAVEEFPEQEPSGKQINQIVDTIKRKGIKVIFAEPQISAKAAEVIASEVPGVTVLYLDPLGNESDPKVSSYIEMMRHNVSVMSEVLQ